MELSYECDKGYTLDGFKTGSTIFKRQCLESGKFSDLTSDKPCKAVTAGKAPAITDATLVEYSGNPVAASEVPTLIARYPEGIEYRCKDGYSVNGHLSGMRKIVSKVNAQGEFAPPLPTSCKEIVFTVRGQVKDARSGGGLHGVKVSIGDMNVQTTSQNGFFTFEGVKPGAHDLKFAKEGFIDTNKMVTVEGNVNSGGIADKNMSPKMRPTEWRVTVKWDKNPEDLDTYVKWGWSKVNWERTQLKMAGIEGKLEKDDVDGYGPETAHLSGVGDCTTANCDIKYEINDYNEEGKLLSTSQAEVTLYNGERVAGMWKISECPGAVSADKNWWHVFTIDGKTNKVKWHCKEGGSGHFLAMKPNSTKEVDFASYVGPFPGRYYRHSIHKRGWPARSSWPDSSHSAVASAAGSNATAMDAFSRRLGETSKEVNKHLRARHAEHTL